jgi:Ser/Thr protein kinase RdoA (MazF antagonist)
VHYRISVDVRAALAKVLDEHYGIAGATLEPLDRGHSNESYIAATTTGRWVVRVAPAGTPNARREREQRVLAAAASSWTPAVICARDGASHVVDRATRRTLQVFAYLPGTPGPRYLGRGDVASMRAAARRLAELHASLAPLAAGSLDGWHWVRERLERVRAGDHAAMPPGALGVLDEIERAIERAVPGPYHALHGDYHLGNVLWHRGEITGVVDFEETGDGSAASELALALFALARIEDDDRFAYDRALWLEGLAAYRAHTGSMPELDPSAFELAFCGYQVLIHLEAAQRGRWSLGPGIGFWPCWNALRR